MNANGSAASVYIDLDSILDTRLGAIATLGDDVALKVLTNNYHKREIDSFDGIEDSEFQTLYSNRSTNGALEKSRLTNIVAFTQRALLELLEQTITLPYCDKVVLDVNIYPFVLDKNIQDEITKALYVLLDSDVAINLMYLNPASLSPSYCKNTYTLMIMYDYNSWMESQAEAFKSTIIPDVTVIGPAMYREKIPDEKELADITTDVCHPFRAMEILAAPLVDLKLIDVSYFSVVSKHKK